ncbi:AAA family ATPase [Tomitella fengzijianii]|uniref:AAA family ATPase n=1 Tax=Tomitella fengzijianii TaxID=2597660 RepID=UPI001E393311|nr:AAA family ATPase [Tomitella fengzijianii]
MDEELILYGSGHRTIDISDDAVWNQIEQARDADVPAGDSHDSHRGVGNHGIAPDQQVHPTPATVIPDPGTMIPDSLPPTGNQGITAPPTYFDVGAMLDGGIPAPPVPGICKRDDSIGLFYRRQFNVVFGDPESGKTLLCDHATVEQLQAGHRVLRLDLDHNGPASTISRLLTFGATEDMLRDPERFLYVEPEDRAHLYAIVEHMKLWQPEFVVIDSIGELLPLVGADSNSADDFTRAHTSVIKPITRTGACVVGIDHLSKGADSRAYGPTGSAAKKRAIGGTSLRVKVDSAFTPSKGGSAYISVSKDRHGGLRQACPAGDKEPLAGKFVLEVTDQGVRGRIRAPMHDERNPEEAVPPEDVAAMAALDPPPSTLRDARSRLGWRADRTSRAYKAWRQQQGGPGDQDTSPLTTSESSDGSPSTESKEAAA